MKAVASFAGEAIITGGSEGIGAGLVAGYRRLGWAVVATARTIKFSARLLDLSPQTLAKGIRAGVIAEITAGNLSALAAIPVLTRARTDDGFDIPVLRAGVQAPSPWDAYTPARPYTGYGASMTEPRSPGYSGSAAADQPDGRGDQQH
jgi:NAD(P)-dependent dehydrogenase (short-subunit alcohol dehydrogenase family)